MTVGELLGKVEDYNPRADLRLLHRAYEYSAQVHKGQKRLSGEPFLTHPLAVADIIADMKLDVAAVVTGLLHDTVEDTLATLGDIRSHFGAEVASLVDGVTKISQLESRNFERAQAESVRKMLLASAKDVRVLLVKLADRAHNLRTIEHLPGDKQGRVASETLELYAPLANRLGVGWLKSEFEESSFRILEPGRYAEIRETLSLHDLEREGYIKEITGLLKKQLAEAGVDAEVAGRTKGAYSIHRKMVDQGLHYDDVYDLAAFRVIVDAERECYDALGIIHMYWRPVPGRFRDYVALPKANRYQSLHTTVIGPYGERMEVQVRTRQMHGVAEFGVAAHWRYKHPDEESPAEAERLNWLKQILEWQQHLEDPEKFLSSVKADLFQDEIFVFTPKGDAKTLKKGETVVDFAYRIHSEIGSRCAGARVNGKLVPLRYQLLQGDTVEVVTTEDSRPTREWLRFVKSQRARDRILVSIRQDERRKAVALGTELLERDLLRRQFDLVQLRGEGRVEELVEHFGRKSEESFLEAVGYGRISTKQVLAHLLPGEEQESRKRRRSLKSLFPFLDRQPRPLIAAAGFQDGMIRFGKCCEPLSGEDIIGFLTHGRGVTVHARECPRLGEVDPERLVEVLWEKAAHMPRQIRLEVTSRDRPGLLAGMSQAIASAGVNIHKAQVRTTGNRAVSVFHLTLHDADELSRVSRKLKRVPGVKGVTRMFGGGRAQTETMEAAEEA